MAEQVSMNAKVHYQSEEASPRLTKNEEVFFFLHHAKVSDLQRNIYYRPSVCKSINDVHNAFINKKTIKTCLILLQF